MSGDLAQVRELACDVAREAGTLLLDYATRQLDVETKTSATDPVSEADRAAETLITQRLLAACPADGILGEEDAANRPGTSGRRWVVDPLDGTVNFLYGIPQWAVSIACVDDAGALVGVVADPSRGELFVADCDGAADLMDAGGATTPLRTTAVDDLGATLVATGFAYDPQVRVDQGRLVARLVADVRDLRRAGAAALDLAWVAAGRLDAYLEFGLSAWDWAAGALLVERAGGVVSSVERRLGGDARTGLVAGGAAAHARLTAWLSD